ncbi:K02A2.6-like, partial [Cordylochernes scorpioides]
MESEQNTEAKINDSVIGGEEAAGETSPLARVLLQLAALLAQMRSSKRTEAELPPFDGSYSARQFFQSYDRKMDDAPDKLLRLPNYLTCQPLELFRKLRMPTQSYFQVRQTLTDLYPESSEASFAKYFAMKLAGQADLETYYREKTAMGLQLGLPQEMILETLTEGLPFSDQRLVRVVPPESLGESFRLAQRIHGPNVPTARHREEQPPIMSGPYPSTPRRTGAWTAPAPPSNCKFCGARHWHSECRYRPAPTQHANAQAVQAAPTQHANARAVQTAPTQQHARRPTPTQHAEDATTAPTRNNNAQNVSIQQDSSHTEHTRDHTSSHNSHTHNQCNKRDTHTKTQQNSSPYTCYNTTYSPHYPPHFTTLLQRYNHIFTQNKFGVPCLKIPQVRIHTNSDKVITIRPYCVPICDQQEFRNQVQQMLENGIIEQSFSPFSSPVTLVTKRNKTKRFCIDYRKVNELISSDAHPLPRIEDILDRLAWDKYFSTADISSAYWQVPIHPDSRPLLAFATLEGLYQPTRLPFGLKTSPQIYERAMSPILQRHGLDCVAHYFDDFIIFSNTLEEHQNHLRQFFAFCEEDEKIKNLMYYLTDSALEWYADEIISNPAIKRWEVVKEKLIQRFGSYNANPIVSASHRRLKREESIENYFQDKIRLLNQTHLTKEEKIHLLTDGLPNDWKDLIVAAQPTDATKWFHIAASIEQNRASIQFKPKNKIHLATKNNDSRKNVCPFWCPICSKKGIKIKHWVTDCEDYDPNYKKDRPNQNTSVKQVCGAPELLNVSTLTNTPTQGAFKLINISVQVNGIPAQAFVDTGATVSIINWRLFKRTRLQLQPNSDIHISQADGVTRTCGSLQTKVRIDKLIKPVTLHVMKNFKYPLLIGLDVASLFNLLIDVKDKTIYTKIDGLQNPILVNHLEEIREHELKELLEHNRNVFSQHAIDLGKVAIQHKIITKSEQPISLRPYRRPLKEYEEIAEQVKELLEHKLIRISDSPWAFPVVMVPKKDGNKRMCIDYRRLNEITLDDRQPLPHIQDMFDRLHGSSFFSTLDVAWGYWQIEMDPQSIQKTAFVTNDGHYEFLVMPFGLKNAASTFQRIIQHILGELLWKGTCSFQDDILVYTKTWQEHIELLSKVFDKLRQYNMKLKLSKCIFGRTEVKYLGHIISHNQLKPDPGKVKSIQDFPRPDTVKKVRQFMGLANYYRKFVKDFSKISFPLVRLTRKNQPFIWNEEVEESFAKLKMALSTKPVLAIYNPDYPSKVYTDASKYGIGAILTQIGPDNEEHVIAYYSKTLQPHQENYSAYEMECLAVIQATDHFHVYIENQPFEIITDHAALQWLFTMKKPKPKYFRWILSLSSKSCNIVHRSGKQQTHVDALSRLPVVNIATQELQEHQQNSDLSFLKNSHTHDGVVMIKQKGVFKAVVPNSLTKKILEEYHDSLSHPSITKTCKLITQCYWWKGITTDIKNYVRSCKSCQLVKVRHEPTLGEMITPTSNIQPLQMIGCDTIVLGTAAANTKHKFIQVFVDHATRYLWAYPTITNTAQAVTQCLNKIIKSVNSINTILTDNGKNFISKEFNKFLSLQGIKHTYTSPYHPQCNGICEKLNDTIMTKLRIAVLEKPRCKWSTLLPQVVKNYNSTPHDVTGFSPLFLMYGIGNVPEFADQTPITIEEARKKASLRTEQSRSWKDPISMALRLESLETPGLCERLNATLTGKLRLLHLENPKIAWTKLVKRVTTIYNSTPHSVTGFPPIYLMFGVLPPELSDHTTPYPDIDRARKIAHTRTQNKHIQDKNAYDQRHKQPHFEIGDLVLVKIYHHPNTGKLAPYFTGPYTILEIISPNVVRIDRPNQPLQGDTDTVHVNKLKLYTENIQYITPPAIKIHHVQHKNNYTFPFRHLTPELFPAESLKIKPANSEPFNHLDRTIFFQKTIYATHPGSQETRYSPSPKTPRSKSATINRSPTRYSKAPIHGENMGEDVPISHISPDMCYLSSGLHKQFPVREGFHYTLKSDLSSVSHGQACGKVGIDDLPRDICRIVDITRKQRRQTVIGLKLAAPPLLTLGRRCGKSHHAPTTTTAPSTFHIGFTTEPDKVDRMNEDNDMQRMTEVGNVYFADALTNMQHHCEDRVSRLKVAMRGLAAPRTEEVIIAPIHISCAANIFLHQLEQADKSHREILALPRNQHRRCPMATIAKSDHQASSQPTPQAPFKTSI